MRTRGIVAVIAAGALLAGAAPAHAGKYLTVKPNPVRQGKTLKVIASNCVSNGHTAYVEVEIFPKGDDRIKRVFRESEGDPTKITIRMKPKRFLPDRYEIAVKCVHEFPDGTVGVWWEDSDTFRVKPSRL